MSRAEQQVEGLVGAAELDVGAHGDRVVALHERIEQLEDRDRRLRRPALGEVVALEQLGDGRRARQAEEVLHAHVQPLGVEAHLEQLGVVAQHLEGLLLVGARVGVDLLARQHRPRRRAAARIADARGVVADDQDHAVAEVLELAQLLQHDGVAEVDVRRRRVEAELGPQLAALALGGLQPALEAARGQRLGGVARQEGGVRSGELPSRANASVERRRDALRRLVATTPQRPVDAALAPRRMSVEYGSNITPLFGDREPPEPPARRRPRVKKRRLLAIFLPLGILAIVSTLFGMMMAVASDLPDLENRKEYQDARNSVLVDSQGQPLGVLTNNQSRVLVRYQDLSPYMTQRDHRDRGPPLLRELGRRRPRHRPRPRAGRAQPQGARRAARRSPSSSSRTRCARSPTARSSRRCARRRSPTTSRASGPRARSSPST